MKQVLRVTTSGEIYLHGAQEFNLQRLQQMVGGYIEVVHPVGLIRPFVMIVDEEGRLKDKPVNRIASFLYSQAEPMVGDMVVMVEGPNEYGENDIIGLTDEQAELCWRYLMEIQRRFAPDTKKKPGNGGNRNRALGKYNLPIF